MKILFSIDYNDTVDDSISLIQTLLFDILATRNLISEISLEERCLLENEIDEIVTSYALSTNSF